MGLRSDIVRRLGELVGPENVSGRTVAPATAEQVATVLALANAEKLRVAPVGNGSQYPPPDNGFPSAPDLVISLARMNGLKQYQPGDLTASMQAGITLEGFSAAAHPHRQWLPLGVPCPSRATMGGILAANSSGPFRQFYGTARDMVIGLRFATVEGKLVKTGGMVVKNVAGYDMAKLLIGSMGTLGVITDVNVKLFPRPATETMLLPFDSAAAAFECRNRIANSVLTPIALDLLDVSALFLVSAPAGTGAQTGGICALAVEYGGVEPVIERNRKEFAAIGRAADSGEAVRIAGQDETHFWTAVCNLPASVPGFWPDAVRFRVSSTLQAMRQVFEGIPRASVEKSAFVGRAGCGVSYVYASGGDVKGFCGAMQRAALAAGAHAVIEQAPETLRPLLDLRGPRRDDYAVMSKLKRAFDPNAILNPGRFVC